MFHCNGWCFPWTIAERAGANVCLRRVEAKAALDAIRDHRVTHMCGAPIVYSMLINAPAELRAGIDHRIAGQIAGAAPPAAIIEGAEKIGIELTHVYGLTETYGPASVCAKHAEWSATADRPSAPNATAARACACRCRRRMTVLDPETMQPVPWDGETMGEIMFRGNITMKGYLKNPTATDAAFAGGWFHTGDLAVMQPDGYVKIRDRSKDIIISGGENISSIEVEETLYRHPAVLSAAVVAQPDEKWGETPCAFIELKPGASVTAEELRTFCREHMARFKVPKTLRVPRAAEDLDREDPEVRAARASAGAPSEVGMTTRPPLPPFTRETAVRKYTWPRTPGTRGRRSGWRLPIPRTAVGAIAPTYSGAAHHHRFPSTEMGARAGLPAHQRALGVHGQSDRRALCLRMAR